MKEIRQKIIVALDTDSLRVARSLVKNLLPYAEYFKIGLELSSSVGAPQAIEMVHKLGGKVFYDGKFNDIPNTIGRASKAISNFKVNMFDVHASSGVSAIREAVKNKMRSKVLGVTILTSLGEKGDNILRFTNMLKTAKADGVVCSPWEAKLIRKYRIFDRLLIVTPGIRPKWAPTQDQKRYMTPREAITAGADYLVIGRPITNPPASVGNSIEAIKLIHEELK